ncbi:MAG: DUF1559 domain-containing protein [Verrucomicrobiae bacterium]|nr:DUF1559 domain-containing protein [Verrucomicrobiae bacterium]
MAKPNKHLRLMAFTLLELLIVISIISILGSLLSVALKKARDQARAIQCMVNLKELASAVMMYANDCDDFPPYARFPEGGEWDVGWDDKLLRAKCIPAPTGFQQGITFCPSSKGESFLSVTEENRAKTQGTNSYIGNNHVIANPDYYPFIKLGSIKNPADILLFYDGPWLSPFRRGIVSENTTKIKWRHGGGANFAFCDGHVEWKTIEQLEYPKNWVP